MASRVALIKGDDRRTNIGRALDLIAGQIDLSRKERILIKPNFVVTNSVLATTHVDAVRAVLDFLRPRTDAWITIAEGSALDDTLDGYLRLGYTDLVKEYKVELIDINRGDWIEVPVYDRSYTDMNLRLSKTVVESDFRISVGPPKTHNTVIVTLSLKNMVMGSLIRDQREQGGNSPLAQAARFASRVVPAAVKESSLMAPVRSKVVSSAIHSDKSAMHMSHALINLNICRLAPYVYPHLSVIDGFTGMEGHGPIAGTQVDLRCAVAGTDFLAADTVAAALMGVEIDDVGYLHYCRLKGLGEGNLDSIEIAGDDLAACRRVFRLPGDVSQQRRWQIDGVERLLEQRWA
jgi:uncharacterized protein (DUF362 family)